MQKTKTDEITSVSPDAPVRLYGRVGSQVRRVHLAALIRDGCTLTVTDTSSERAEH
jgi:hypothetical protein